MLMNSLPLRPSPLIKGHVRPRLHFFVRYFVRFQRKTGIWIVPVGYRQQFTWKHDDKLGNRTFTQNYYQQLGNINIKFEYKFELGNLTFECFLIGHSCFQISICCYFVSGYIFEIGNIINLKTLSIQKHYQLGNIDIKLETSLSIWKHEYQFRNTTIDLKTSELISTFPRLYRFF